MTSARGHSDGGWARWVAATALLVAATIGAAWALEVPYLSGRVVDGAGMLSPQAAERLSARLAELERATGAQVVVLTVPSLEDEPLEDYSLRVAETWALGGAERDNGLLLLIARQERRMRIEVGYGLEPVVPDIMAARVMDEIMQPRFRAGDFDGGVEAAIDALAGLIEGDPEALPSRPQTTQSSGISFFTLFVIVLVVILLINFARRGGGRGGGRGGRGGGLRRGPPIVILPTGRGGGFGGFGSGGGGFGGFSGGGGGFGGGGASGSW